MEYNQNRRFYSNCLIECIKAKLRNRETKLKATWSWKERYLHFYWIEDKTVYHFTTDKDLNFCEHLMFEGSILRNREEGEKP